MTKKQKTSKTAFKYIIGIVFAVLVVAAVTCGVIAFMRQLEHEKDKEKDNAQNRNTASDILKTEDDLKDEEKVAESSNTAKDIMDAEAEQKTVVEQDDSGLKIAKPEISFIADENGQIAVGGQVTNINETEGTCTYVFTKGDSEVSASAGILPNPSYISCETARIDKSKFTSGVWSVKIEYKSKTAEGASEAQNFTIQ